MDSIRIRKVIAVLGALSLAVLGGLGAGCSDKDKSKGCGNGLLGIGEECDCGSDPNDLPNGCTAVNGAVESHCTDECTITVRENCDNTVDDDDDGLVDCADEECDEHPRCLPETICNDLLDNDGDGHMDCDDPDCLNLDVCLPEQCTNGEDDNNDGFTDCQDAQCLLDAACTGVEVCWGGVDDDGDGYTDCDDPDCLGESVCEAEDCGNGLDDDGDFKVDCADRSCIESTECAGTACAEALIDGSVTLALTEGNQVARLSMDVSQEADDNYGQCDVTNGREYVLEIRLSDPGRLRVVYDQTGAHRFGLYFKGGPSAGCEAAMHACTVPLASAGGVLEYGALPASEYYLIISEDAVGVGGPVDLVLTLVDPNPANVTELCDNELDDDANGQLDCGDLACYYRAGQCDQSGCTTPPVADYDIGTLVLGTNPVHPMPGADPALMELNTVGGGSNYPITGCQGLFGQDQMVQFTLDAPSIIQVGFRQNMQGAGDHVLALFFAGAGCSVAEHECMDPGGVQDGVLTFAGDPSNGGRYPAGDYFLVTKAMQGSAGRIDLQIITMDVPEEVCLDAGFDNDFDSDANCDDSDCAAHHVCVPEDCSTQNVDEDGDGLMGCLDTDPDDACSCSYACACYGQPSCDPADFVCDGEYDDEVLDFGTVYINDSLIFDADTSVAGVRADYDMEHCHGSPGSTMPDVVLYFTLTTQADIEFNFTQAAGVEHSGLLMHADRCRACDDAGPGAVNQIFCYSSASPWGQANLSPGSYALLLKALPGALPGEAMSGHFTGTLDIYP